jgi:hypothetical protein
MKQEEKAYTEHAVRVQRYVASMSIDRLACAVGTADVSELAGRLLVHQWADLLEVDHKELALDLSVSYPRDWWEALKDRWFPRWALQRWPVRLTTVERRGKIRAASILPDLKVIPGRRVVYVAQIETGGLHG